METPFSHYKSMGNFLDAQVFIQSAPKPYAAFLPPKWSYT